MDCEVIQINENSWRIEDSGVRCFLLTGSEKALLIDSGRELHTARDIAESLTALPVSLLNTHADRDHIGSNEQFESFYMHPAEEAHYRRSGRGGTIVPVKEGDTLDLGGRELRIVDLPGHTSGSIAVLDVRNRVLISGDPVQEHGRIFMFGAHRNMENYIRSLEHLEAFTDQFDEIWPSHADFPVYPGCISKIREGAEKIVNGEVAATETEFFGRKIRVYNLGFTAFLCAE